MCALGCQPASQARREPLQAGASTPRSTNLMVCSLADQQDLQCAVIMEWMAAALTMLLDCKMFSSLENCDEILHSVGVSAHGNRMGVLTGGPAGASQIQQKAGLSWGAGRRVKGPHFWFAGWRA